MRLPIAVLLFSMTSMIATAKPGTKATNKVGNRADEIASDLDSYNQGSYGMAGCGLGSIVIKSNSGAQIFAATTNGSTYTQFFGITSGTSNCVDGKRTAMEQKVFIENNFAQLSIEASRGDGEHLRAFAELLGCDAQEFTDFSRANHSEIFSAPASDQILKVYRDGIGSRCERLS